MNKRRRLLDLNHSLFARNEPLENRENAFAIFVNPVQIRAEVSLIIPGVGPLVDDLARDVDILAQGIEGVSAQEKAVKEGSFPVRCKWVEIVNGSHR